MLHKPYHDWMHAWLDGTLAPAAQRQLEEHLAACLECQAAWDGLSAVQRRLASPVLMAPRPGFTARFNARLAQRRSRPRLVWGAVALGLGSVAAAAIVAPLGLALFLSGISVVQHPATALAMTASLSTTLDFARTVFEALYISARALLEGALASPLTWALGLLALALTALWLYLMRKLLPERSPR